MRIGISANPNKPRAVELARRAVKRIGDRAEILLTAESARAMEDPRSPTELRTMRADLVLALGGDGTFLYALQHTDLPILAVHAGTVGFLAEIDGDDAAFDRALERILAQEYTVEDRMKLGVQIGDEALPDATNEVVVHTSQVAKIRQYEIAVDGVAVGRVRADGVILATPTGSTSYALSALGPIVDPAVESILVATLAPFQLTQRAVLIDPLRSVSVRVTAPEKDAVVVVDGQEERPLRAGEQLRAYRSPRRASFVRFGPGFFRRMGGRGILPWAEVPSGGSKG